MGNFIKKASHKVLATIGAAALYVLFQRSVEMFDKTTRKKC